MASSIVSILLLFDELKEAWFVGGAGILPADRLEACSTFQTEDSIA